MVAYLVACQPVMGYLQHRYFVKRGGGRSIFGYLHRWLGRAMLVLGVVNGGLGLWTARREIGEEGASRGVIIAYGVVAGVVGVVYLVVVAGSNIVKARRAAGSVSKEGQSTAS